MNFRPTDTCRYDGLALGEIMLRMDPGEGRIRTSRLFRAWEGGGEYNAVRALSRCFRLKSAVATAFVDNEVGHLLEDMVLQGGVDTSLIKWVPYDGICRSARNGINFTERGFGIRGALGNPDRANTAVSQLKPGDYDWEDIFGRQGVRWFHTGGIFAGLSESCAEVALEAMQIARKHGTIVSYDFNYRPSLWKTNGGVAHFAEVNRSLLPHTDVVIGTSYDYKEHLGLEGVRVDDTSMETQAEAFRDMITPVIAAYPNIKVLGHGLRKVHSASNNDWSGIIWCDGQVHRGPTFMNMDILDRVGGGDGFLSGLMYGLMTMDSPAHAVACGVAHGALTMTTPGDTSMATLEEVLKLASGGNAKVQR